MSADLRVENILIQVRCKLQETGVKLWLQPYYAEGIGSIDAELEVSTILLYASGFGIPTTVIRNSNNTQ